MKPDLKALTNLIRYDILTMTTAAGSGHPTTSLSAVELMTALWFDGHYQYDPNDPKYIFNDRMIFSKGHASPLLYALYHAAGWIEYDELLTLRQFTSRLEGHPTTDLPWVDVATGSLGQGLSVGIGMALGIKLQMKSQKMNVQREPNVYVLMGDSEFSEGQVYEALQVASEYKLNNLIGILDVNRLGQRGETMLGWDIKTYKERIESFGWNTIVIEEGNDIEAVQKAIAQLSTDGSNPTMIIAKTKKGAGISSVEDKDGWHGKPLPKELMEEGIKELGKIDKDMRGTVEMPEKIVLENSSNTESLAQSFDIPAEPQATREAYGATLKLIAKDQRVVVLDAETSNSTFAETMKEVAPERFFEMFIAEQNMVSVALGMSKIGLIPFASSFAAFLSRAYDQIRMCQYSAPNVTIVGSHAGVSIGEDGSSQMALEDLGMMRSLLHAVVLYPSDPVSTIKLVDELRTHDGLSYLRLTRAKSESLYETNESFPIGGSKVLVSSEKDDAVIIAAGITVHEALKAQKELAEKGTNIAVIDAYSVKPLDTQTIVKYATKTGHVIVVEDHYPDGGLGDSVRQALDGMDVKFTHLAVGKTPRSGTSAELLNFEKIDAEAIVKAVR
ncbi:transketolase [Candidatus Roizmanbacteria bacterium CG_4_10_14_0_2_um_filter_39_13]|uniref:Transketolase n=1 Tax=Candidatus Roizmanbacteria bacterium CG_4_10_14_0_2_um_filter_39_13 TaxID=1974825 RepID=A0A2M7U015_9BACT|nr:MAG: transketolase [Candidatus Roizmanbacteria bacterium CG_4_10_14_0_2_um_filter_39_13]